MNKNIRNRTVALATLLVFLVLGACDKTTNITQVTMPGDERDNDSLYLNTNLFLNVIAHNFLGLVDTTDLYPSFILQTDGLRRMYAYSPFVKEELNNDIMLFIKNPGVGKKLSITMPESEINEEFTGSYVVEEKFANMETLVFDFPVIWKHEVLRHWRLDKVVNLRWDLRLNDVLTETENRTFTCHSINKVALTVSYDKKEEPNKYNYYAGRDYGNFPHWENDDMIVFCLDDLIAGYIDENSPRIEHMKRELLEDGYTKTITGGTSCENEDQLNDIKGFSYLLQKHRVAYGVRNTNKIMYIRSFDDVFTYRNGYTVELTAAFVSWCINLGINSKIYNLPGYVYPIVEFCDNTLFPWDPALLCSKLENFPTLDVLTKENKEEADKLFEEVADVLSEFYQRDLDNEKQSPMLYYTIDVKKLREYLPSFNASEEYWTKTHSRSSAPREMKIVTRKLKAKN